MNHFACAKLCLFAAPATNIAGSMQTSEYLKYLFHCAHAKWSDPHFTLGSALLCLSTLVRDAPAVAAAQKSFANEAEIRTHRTPTHNLKYSAGNMQCRRLNGSPTASVFAHHGVHYSPGMWSFNADMLLVLPEPLLACLLAGWLLHTGCVCTPSSVFRPVRFCVHLCTVSSFTQRRNADAVPFSALHYI